MRFHGNGVLEYQEISGVFKFDDSNGDPSKYEKPPILLNLTNRVFVAPIGATAFGCKTALGKTSASLVKCPQKIILNVKQILRRPLATRLPVKTGIADGPAINGRKRNL